MKLKSLTKKQVNFSNAQTFMASQRVKLESADAGDIIGIHNHGTIKIGDTLLIRKLDGLDPLIMWGTGAHAGHYAMFLNFS